MRLIVCLFVFDLPRIAFQLVLFLLPDVHPDVKPATPYSHDSLIDTAASDVVQNTLYSLNPFKLLNRLYTIVSIMSSSFNITRIPAIVNII